MTKKNQKTNQPKSNIAFLGVHSQLTVREAIGYLSTLEQEGLVKDVVMCYSTPDEGFYTLCSEVTRANANYMLDQAKLDVLGV